jgi:DNA-directed RNA polymerase specialized sigma24 family protein
VKNTTIEDILPVAGRLCRLKAKSVIGQCGLRPDDREDIESQLLLALYSRLPRYNSRRCSVRTFTCRVIDKEIASIFRYRLAHRRLQLGRPDLVDDIDDPITSLSDAHAGASSRLFQNGRCQDFWLDVGKVTERLPEATREVAAALRCGSPTEASRNLGLARSAVYERIGQIRSALLKAGIGPGYFSPGGAQ